MRSLQAQLVAEGHHVSLSKLCGWLGVPRRSIYYKPKARTRLVDPNLAERVRVTMQRFPTYGYRRLAIVLGENKKPIQRILQINRYLPCLVRKGPARCIGCRDRLLYPRDPRLATLQQRCHSNRGGCA